MWGPNNAVLHLHTSSPTEHARRYQADAATCNSCPLKAQCTPGTSGRYISRNFAEAYFERVSAYQTTEAYQKALRKRSVWVEPLFAEGKDWHGMRRFRLRELWRVNCEGVMRAAGQNLKRLLKKRGWGRRPFPAEAICTSFWGLLRHVLVLVLEKWSVLATIGSTYSTTTSLSISLC